MQKECKKMKSYGIGFVLLFCFILQVSCSTYNNKTNVSVNPVNVAILQSNNSETNSVIQYQMFAATLPRYDFETRYFLGMDAPLEFYELPKKFNVKKTWQGQVTNFLEFIEVLSNTFNILIKYDDVFKQPFKCESALAELSITNQTILEVLQETFEICREFGFPDDGQGYNPRLFSIAIIHKDYIQLTCAQAIQYKEESLNEAEEEFSLFEEE